MRTRKRGGRRRGWLVVGSFLVLILPVAVLWLLRDEAPVNEMLGARRDWNGALERAGAWSEELRSAGVLLDSAQASMDRQFVRLPLFQRFGDSRGLLAAARESTRTGDLRAMELRLRSRSDLETRWSEVRNSLVGARTLLESMETNRAALRGLTSAESRLEAARGLLETEHPDEVIRMLDQADSEVAVALVHLHERLRRFLDRRNQWKQWSRELVEISRRSQGPAVLVDKLNHTCYLLRNGAVQESFPIEMGRNWMNRKLYAGDMATPEGRYQISQLKTGTRTIYYKAALLDYPNDEDRERYRRGRRTGDIPDGAGIGSLIEIHGKGGRGSDWTLGCVSLTNEDMDRLMPHLQVGTPVFIVGYWREPSWLGRLEGLSDG